MNIFVRLLIAAFLLPGHAVFAIDVDAPLNDPAHQALYARLTDEVRCLVCQNQTIGDSSAPLAADLRREIRERIAEGQSEIQIKDFLTERYGDFVLYKPRYGGRTMLLWLAPALLLIFGTLMLWRMVRRRSRLPVPDETKDSPVDASGWD